MAEHSSFADFVRRIREGNEEAARDLVRQFEPVMRLEVRRRLNDPSLYRLFDSMDICQSVLASFFVRTAAGQYDLEKPEDMEKELLVNGYGMTNLTPITKVMAHMPLAFLDRPPKDALVICFGMGTTFRALHSWGIPVTAAELVPSVPKMFDYYHADGASILASPLSHVVIDDGRRFLERTSQQFDLITIDPPPPVQAAGSSMLYSEEFYSVAKRKLRAGGILQQWLPVVDVDRAAVAAAAKSLRASFPYVRVFWDEFGTHFLCSDHPLPARSADELVKRLPAAAVIDFAEWSDLHVDDETAARQQFQTLLDHELTLDRLIAGDAKAPALTDDRPVNEYYVLRHWMEKDPVVGDEEYP